MTATLHVERTPELCVLRWITHDDSLRASGNGPRTPVPGSAMYALPLTHVSLEDGAIQVRISHGDDWPALAANVQRAIVADLAARADWLFTSSPNLPPVDMPSVEAVQATVIQAVGALLQAHGGHIEVVAVEDGRANVQLHGACHGCSGAGITLEDTVRTAVRQAHPHITTLVVIEPPVQLSSNRLRIRIRRQRTP